MILKDKIFDFLAKKGAHSAAEIAAKFKVKQPSVRRSCGELIQAGKLVSVRSDKGHAYNLSSDARAAMHHSIVDAIVDIPEKSPSRSRPQPSLPKTKNKNEETPLDPTDWRMTDFTF